MESKDNRSKEKRSKMKQYNRRMAQRATVRQNTSSSETVGVMRAGVIDVADSSDETIRRGWVSATIPSQQRNLDMLDDVVDMDDDLDTDVGNAQMRAGDFDIMSQMPVSIGGHFQFSSEKNWETAEGEQFLDNTEASEYFTLNLKLLNVGLQTIPFYKRMDYSAAMFTKEQLLSMEKAAELEEKTYQNVLKEHETNPRIKINSGSRRSGSGKSQTTAKIGSGKANYTTEQQDELDELLNLTTAQVKKTNLSGVTVNEQSAAPSSNITPTGNESTVGNKDDIQQWLDNVLDE